MQPVVTGIEYRSLLYLQCAVVHCVLINRDYGHKTQIL